MAKTKKTVAKKILKSNEFEQAKVEFESFYKRVKDEYDNVEVEIVIKSEI
ncbi:hypothetical protein ABC382_08955 [Lysinibacillus sp. 1P01SD]